MHSILNRAVRHAMARDKVKRNVVALCDIPNGRLGRPSKSLTFEQADALLTAAEGFALHAYIVLSLLIGARTEEFRALHWREVDLTGNPHAIPAIPPSIAVYRSVRVDGDTKTMKSRRRLALPQRCIDALRRHRDRLPTSRTTPDTLVFGTANGTELDHTTSAARSAKSSRKPALIRSLGHPCELRHSFVSLLSANGVRIEDISRLVGHSASGVTERVYRHQLHAALDEGATVVDGLFPPSEREG